jgi:hypothetical protein
MINQQNITFDFLQSTFKPVIHSGFSPITNLCDQYLGYYAYYLQMSMVGICTHKIDEALENSYTLVDRPLEKIVLPMIDIKIISTIHTKKFKDFSDAARVFEWLPCIELLFQVSVKGITKTVVIRDGFLLKSIIDAEITDFNQLENYNAVFVYNNLNVNPELSAFIKFQKK